jgi:two-component system CheB/CheR fusion protein
MAPARDVPFPIVGIGASAGGLAAIETFFSSLGEAGVNDAAFVIVQHLAPDHKSLLTQLVARFTSMPVAEVTDGMKVERNCVYVIPPKWDLGLDAGVLRLMEPAEPRGQRLTIDFFFRALAADQHEKAICIVLSGSGSDGALGVRAVKGEGGMAMAQAPEDAEYASMPRSAIDTGLVDYVLPAATMPATLIAYIAHAFGSGSRPIPAESSTPDDALRKIFVLLRGQTGHDFSSYKRNTVVRRLERRMAVNNISRLDDYLPYLQKSEAEVEELFRDLLIGVTHFFRDPGAFEALERSVIPELFAARPDPSDLRVWTPGCSTGEEAYSIAILLHETNEKLRRGHRIRIFATDLDSAAIARARAGFYPTSIAADVTQQRLERYFTYEPDGAGYRISKSIRDMLIFSEQDLIRDPPFSKLDLISCRNLLIYLGTDLQKRIIPLFHYALRPGGFLFLGTSESVGEFVDLFPAQDRKWKIYHRKGEVRLHYPLPPAQAAPDQGKPAAEPAESPGLAENYGELVKRTLLRDHTPASVLVNRRGDILYCHGRTGLYLEPAPGEADMNVLKMAREGLRRNLAVALHESAARHERVTHSGIAVKTNGGYTSVDLTVSPVQSEASQPPLFLIVLKAGSEPAAEVPDPEAVFELASDQAYVWGLKRELLMKEQYLQTTNEELETTNEELKASNEEMQSMNEELQSMNEELETSKEEMQSINEELMTVNSELQQKLGDLSRVNNDMANLLAGTGVGTIFVDHQLRILRFTPAVTQLVNLIPTDVGRPVGHIVSNLMGYDRLVEDLQGTLDTLIPVEVEVKAKSGLVYLMRIRPYRTQENAIEGAVITFVDITDVKQTQDALRESDAKCRLLFDSMPQGVIFYDARGRIADANHAAGQLLGTSLARMRESDSEGAAVCTDGTQFSWDASPAMMALKTGRAVEGVVIGIPSPDGATTWIRLEALPLFKPGDDKPFQVYTTLTRIGAP